MRLLAVGFVALFVTSLAASPRQKPANHPADPAGAKRSEASKLTEKLRPSDIRQTPAPVPRKNLIDEFIFSKMDKDGIPHAGLSSDEEFFRRVHIDLTGRTPHDDELRAFLTSTEPDKRDKLVDQLVKSRAYEAKWTYFFGDLFKNAWNRIGNDGKNVFAKWIHDNIHMDRPYNLMVQEMLTANAISNWYVGPASYVARWVVIGANCDEEIHEDTADEEAINSAKHFLGVDLTCFSCHDGRNHLEKINLWASQQKREEVWKMAAFFGKTRVLRRTEITTAQDEYSIDDDGPGYDPSAPTVVRVPRTGKKGLLDPAYMFTRQEPDPGQHPRPQYAKLLTADPQFARAAVNLLWAEMFGVGIVDPPLDFDLARIDPKNPPPAPWTLQPSHPELLEALAQYFRDHNYSLRSVLTLIAKSNAYQLSSSFPGEWKAAYEPYFARKFVRRLKAEEIYDSLVNATNQFTDVPIPGTDIKVKYVTELYDAEDIRPSRVAGREDDLQQIHFFLESFGQTNREYSERVNEGDITQAVLLMNSPLVLKQVKASETSFLGGLLKDAMPDETRIFRLFERFLIRQPTSAEVAAAKKVLAGSPGVKGWEDLQWLLVNKVEFVHNF